jgi:hypothetical protein
MDKKTLDRMRELAGFAPIAETVADKSRNNMYQINESLKAVNETFADDDELEEGAKPDFSDIDDDGDKEETALKAAADAKAKDDTKTESQQMREWAKSVYETVEDLDETDGCNCGAVCSCKDADETLEEETEELAENAKATSLGKSAHKDHKRQPTSDPRLMHLMNNDGMRDNSSFNQSPYLKAWLAGYDSMATNETQQMREWSNSVYQNYEDTGHIMAQPEGETVDLSLRRYLNAEPSKVQVAESHTPKSLTESYKSFKAKK